MKLLLDHREENFDIKDRIVQGRTNYNYVLVPSK